MDDQWIIDLKAKIEDAKDAQNFDDIIKCYQNGLLRAGYLLAWLMLVESLKRRIVTLADKEVKVAIQQLEEINKVENQMRSNDEVIWKSAAKCDLLSKEDENVVELLWNKRCIMSHPYMPEVKESDFRYMVENLVSLSLAKKLEWSKTMIEDFISSFKNNLHLIPDDVIEKRELADQVLALVPKRLYPFYWKTVSFEYSQGLEEGKRKAVQMLQVMAMMFVRKVGEDINETKYGLEAMIRDHCVTCWCIFYADKIWPCLEEKYQGQMFRFLVDNREEGKKVLNCAYSLLKRKNDIDKKYVDCYYKALGQCDVLDIERYYLDKDVWLDRLYEEKISKWQFDDQKEFIGMLSSMEERELNAFSAAQQEKIGCYVQMCCYNDTFKAQDFVKSSNIWTRNSHFAKGFVISGMTDEKGNLRISKKNMTYVLPVLYKQSEITCKEIFLELDKKSVEENPMEDYFYEIVKKMIREYYEPESYQYKALEYLLGKYYKHSVFDYDDKQMV